MTVPVPASFFFHLKKVIVFLLFMLPAGLLPLAAQDKAPADSAQKTEELIPATRFAVELPSAYTTLQQIRDNLLTTGQLAALKQETDTLFREIDTFRDKMSRADTGALDRKALQNLIYLWNQKKEKLLSEQEVLEDRLGTLQESLSQTNRILQLWKKSLEVNSQDLNDANKAVLDSFVAKTQNLTDTITKKSVLLMKLLQGVSNRLITINKTISFLETDLEKSKKVMLESKGTSLFKVIAGKSPEYIFMGNLRENISISLPSIRDYLHNNRFNLLWIVLIFFAFYILLYFLNKQKEEEIPEEKEKTYIGKAFILVSRPLWTSFFLSLLTARFILTGAPHDLYILLYSLTLLPLFMLVPPMLNREHRRYFFVIGSLFLLDNISELLFYGYILNNLVLMGLSLLLIITILRHSKASVTLMVFPGKVIGKLVMAFHYLTSFILSATIIATFFGFYHFQEFVVTAYIWTYFAIYLYNTANITIAALFEYLLYGKWTSRYKSISKNRDILTQKISLLLNFFTFFLWLYTIVALFGFKEEVASAIVAIWNFGFRAGTLNVTIGNLTLFIFVLWLSLKLARITQTLLEEDVLVRFHLDRGIPESISTLVKYTIGIIGFFIAAGAAGIKMNNLAFIFGALGVGIGFGLQDIINNFISGLILLFERPIHIGDNISVGELEGVVKHIGIRSSIIQSYDRSEVVVPNGKLISNELINWTLSNEMRRLEIQVGVAYGTDPEKVMKILKDCALSHKEVMKEPPPYVWFDEFAESSMDFRLLFFYPRFSGGMTVRSEIAVSIVNAFRENGITIPFPQMDIYIKEAMKKMAGEKGK